MSSNEAGVSYTAKDPKGNLTTIRGEDAAEFALNAKYLLSDDADAFVTYIGNVFRSVLPVQTAPTEQQAVDNVVRAFPNAQVSTVGQPLPQPGREASVELDDKGYPKNPQPGQLFDHPEHGTKKYVAAGVSKAGKAYQAFWGRP